MKLSSPLNLFLIIAYVGSYGIALTIFLAGKEGGSLKVPLGLLSMFIPTISALIVKVTFKYELPEIQWRHFSLKYSLIGVFTPIVISIVCMLGYLIVTEGRLPTAQWLIPDASGMFHPGPDSRFGSLPLSSSDLYLKISVGLILNFFIIGLFVIGEEFGWRGFLQPALEKSLDTKKVILSTAVIWALWHCGFDAVGMNLPSHVVMIGTLVAGPLMRIGLGIFLGWLYLRTRSIWVVVLSHAAANNLSQYPLRFLDIQPHHEVPMLVIAGIGMFSLGLFVLQFLIPKKTQVG